MELHGDFPGHPGAKTLHFQSNGHGSTPGWGTKIPHAAPHKKKGKKKVKPHEAKQGQEMEKSIPASAFDPKLKDSEAGSVPGYLNCLDQYMSFLPCARVNWLFTIHAPPKPLIDAKRRMDLFFIVHPLVLLEFLTKFMYHSFLSKETNIYIFIYIHTENARLESKSMILLGLKVLSALLCVTKSANCLLRSHCPLSFSNRIPM